MFLRGFTDGAKGVAVALTALVFTGLGTHATAQEAVPEIVRDPEVLAEGKRTFSIHCSRCHGLTGMGVQSTGGGGPNLRDDEWIHGSSFGQMVSIVWNGVSGTLMKSWRRDLGAERIQQVVAYIYSFRLEEPL